MSAAAPPAGDPRLHRTIWRWHFYAGLFCLPFVLWLAVTGAIYLFKPQVERWLDRPYDQLVIDGPRAAAAAQVQAALAAVPGARLNAYELPRSDTAASRVLVGRGADLVRVYVHPQTLAILRVVREDDRLMRVIFRLHGELMAGDYGSYLVELAASWAIVMLLSGLYLWWPREAAGLAGVLYPRLGAGGRRFWRDLHAVTGVWVTAFALFLLVSGLPWAKSWGGLLKTLRAYAAPAASAAPRADWTSGRSDERGTRRRQVAKSQRFLARRRRVKCLFSEPPIEILAAAVACRWWCLRTTLRVAARAEESDMEMVIVPPPRSNLRHPGSLRPALAAQLTLNSGVDENAFDQRLSCDCLQ